MGFFLFDKKFGFFYSIAASIPLLVKIDTLRVSFFTLDKINGTLSSPFFEIIVALNLITLLITWLQLLMLSPLPNRLTVMRYMYLIMVPRLAGAWR